MSERISNPAITSPRGAASGRRPGHRGQICPDHSHPSYTSPPCPSAGPPPPRWPAAGCQWTSRPWAGRWASLSSAQTQTQTKIEYTNLQLHEIYYPFSQIVSIWQISHVQQRVLSKPTLFYVRFITECFITEKRLPTERPKNKNKIAPSTPA